MKSISKLQFITQQNHLALIEKVCKAGIDWVQLRMKDVDIETYTQTAIQARQICNQYQCKLIINDNPQIALASKADGVHLGKSDISPEEARKMLGDTFIIGGTANTIEDIRHLAAQNVDYIGLGPFRFTETKKNLSPILGIEGYQSILNLMKMENIQTPIIAIGGLNENDIRPLLETGVYGIAVSSQIAKATDIQTITTNFLNLLK